MLNRDVFSKDPSTRKLVNEGFASVNDSDSPKEKQILRYELETFVCDGQYEKGLYGILDTFLRNINQAQQPSVWVSGFFGSGKSHLVKMLRALWEDTPFEDGTTARSLAQLPQDIKDHLKDLETQGKRHGGLHAASGTLGASAHGSIRLALLNVIFKSRGLPQQYSVARFLLWLKREGLLETVRERVCSRGLEWSAELDNFYVAEGLHRALAEVRPATFSSPAVCAELLMAGYPYVTDIGNEDMIKTIRQALSRDGKFPLTLIVLDEVQQYIGESTERSRDVQEVVEACCSCFGGKVLFVGTGQTAITGTPLLKRLEGRFTIRVELSDTDVDGVVRKVILAKKPEAIGCIENIMEANMGEISRHLSQSSLRHKPTDVMHFPADYPILPVRRRFWEHVLRVLDESGTDSQLRNKLGMIHKAIQCNLDKSLGNVVPADYLFFDSAVKLLQSSTLPRPVYEKTMIWAQGTADESLMARACGLVFLINKLGLQGKELGIRATTETLADLLVEDITVGSGSLRNRLPSLLDKCDLLMRVNDEYRIQTEESSAWNDEFSRQKGKFHNQPHSVEAERNERIRDVFSEMVPKTDLVQGKAKISRKLAKVFDAERSEDWAHKICIWVRDGWNVDENTVRAEALQAGNESPTIFVLIPRRSSDELRHFLIEYKAAVSTLTARGNPDTPEGQEAKGAMETIRDHAANRMLEIIGDAVNDARVFQGGGQEIEGVTLQGKIMEAAENSLQRMYPQFHLADDSGWGRVYTKAKEGAPDALRSVGFDGEPCQNPVCKQIKAFIGGGKSGAEIRKHFEGEKFGWSGDAVDGGLLVLLSAGLIQAVDEHAHPIVLADLERKQIGKAVFKVELTMVTARQRLEIRKLFQAMGVSATSGNELKRVPEFLEKLTGLAGRAGGEAPKPERPDTSLLNDIRLAVSNEQLLVLFNNQEALKECIDLWGAQADRIGKRWAFWQKFQDLLGCSNGLQEAEELNDQARVIAAKRLLLAEPDLVAPLVKELEALLRKEFLARIKRYKAVLCKGMNDLEEEPSWGELAADEKDHLLKEAGIAELPAPAVSTHEELVSALRSTPLKSLEDRTDALTGRFARLREKAARSLEPETTTVQVIRRTLKTEEDVSAWVREMETVLLEKVHEGPVLLN